MEKKETDVDVIVGIAINGIPYAMYIAEELGLDFAVFRPHHEKQVHSARTMQR